VSNLVNFKTKIREAGRFARVVSTHISHEYSLPFLFIKHSGFDTVPQQQKQRWLDRQACQRTSNTPRKRDIEVCLGYLKAVVERNLCGNESAQEKVLVGGIVL